MLFRAEARHVAPVGLLYRRRGYSGLNQHMHCNRTDSIHHAADIKDLSSNRGNDCDFEKMN